MEIVETVKSESHYIKKTSSHSAAHCLVKMSLTHSSETAAEKCELMHLYFFIHSCRLQRQDMKCQGAV